LKRINGWALAAHSFIRLFVYSLMIALIHDWLNQQGGAEDVLVNLHQIFPQAPIFTSIYDRARMPAAWRSWDIRSTALDKLPGIHSHHQPYMPLFAQSWAQRKIPAEYDLLLSNKSAFCIGARALNPRAKHVCYCLTPTRFTYDFESYVGRGEKLPRGAATALRALNAVLRKWETRAAQRVHTFIAISHEVQQRIKTLYGRESVIVYPPVEMPSWDPNAIRNTQDVSRPASSVGYYLIVSRLLPYKRVDLAIEAFSQLGLPLVIAGDGRDRARLEQLAAQSAAKHANADVKFLGRVSDETLHELLTDCTAFVFPGFEDFGIAPIRAMAYGKPVIAFAKGGALDTVIDGVTGTLFREQRTESLVEAVQKNSRVRFAPAGIRQHAEQFSAERFQREMLEIFRKTIGD
jgi:glycosyltransferase involved in cell wall biosynthesis